MLESCTHRVKQGWTQRSYEATEVETTNGEVERAVRCDSRPPDAPSPWTHEAPGAIKDHGGSLRPLGAEEVRPRRES